MTDLVLAFVSFIFMLVLSCFCLATVSRCIKIYIIKINQLSVLCSACDFAHEPPTHPPSATRTRAEDLYIKLLLSNVLHLNLTPSGLNRGSGGGQISVSIWAVNVRSRRCVTEVKLCS